MKFSFLAFTETWINESNHELYRFPGYNCTKGGGVSLAIRRDISYKVRNELEYFDSEMESLFIEIDRSAFSATNDIIMGVIYRMLFCGSIQWKNQWYCEYYTTGK